MQALDTTAELGGKIVTTHAGVLPEDKTDPSYQTLLDSVGEIADHGAKVGVYFALETGQESPQALGDFIDEIGNPWLRVNYDPCNLLRFGSEAGTIQGVHILGDKIIHSHAKDWNPETKQATCGEGLVPWDGYIQALRDIGYSGVLAIEDETGNDDMIASIGRSLRIPAEISSMINIGILGAGGIAALSHLPEIAQIAGMRVTHLCTAVGRSGCVLLCDRFDVPRYST